uniref:Choline transporter-like protein n=1 Tax=Paramormyrops kingsleyae TaxID=1676925 RepID=A0A3B3QMR8_9TELE
MGCCGSAERARREWKPLEDRSCTDVAWLLIFVAFCVGMGSICGYAIITGAAGRLISGYDSYGNTCGQPNAQIEGIKLTQSLTLSLVLWHMAHVVGLLRLANGSFLWLCISLLPRAGHDYASSVTVFLSLEMLTHVAFQPHLNVVWIHRLGGVFLCWVCIDERVFLMWRVVGVRMVLETAARRILAVLGSPPHHSLSFRDKTKLPVTPILSSTFRLIRYHLGTVAKGSFIITLVKIPRLILMYIHNQLKGKENACARCMLKACICCLWCLEKCLNYLNQNAYAATAINSTSFCTSARDAFVILVENALRVAAINAVGDFVLFLGKVLIVSCTAFAGVLALNYQRDYTVWLLPLLIVCLFAFLVAHCFLSIFEIVVDVLFLCFAIDTKHNDGSTGREFYMDKALMVRTGAEQSGVGSVSKGRAGLRVLAAPVQQHA